MTRRRPARAACVRARFPRTALSAALALAAIAAAHAATPPADDDAAAQAPTARTLDTLEVTGRRLPAGSYAVQDASAATGLALPLRRTPQSVTVLTRGRLDDLGLFALNDIMAQVPGVQVSVTDSERISFVSRGYNITNFQVDGMLNTFGGSVRTNTDSAIYERIEVVRGATGLTTGAGDPSGVVNFVRKRPGDTFQAGGAITVGRWNNHRLEADIGGPLALDGRIRARVVAAKQQSDSFRDRYRQDKDVFYGIVQADLTDDTLLEVGYEYQAPRTYGVTWGVLPYWNDDGTLAHLPRSANLSAEWSSWPIVEDTAFARLSHVFGNGWSAQLAYSRAERDTDGRVYYGGAGYPDPVDGSGVGAWTSHFAYGEKMEVVDLNLSGPFRLFGRDHELLAGYGESRREGHTPLVEYLDVPPGYAVIPDWRDFDGDVPLLPTVVRPYPASESELTQKAGYLASRLSLTEPLTAVVGARYGSWETRSWNHTYDAQGNRTGTRTGGYRPDDVFTPYAGLIWDFTDALSAYASYTDIFQPQNYRDRNDEYLEPVVGDNWEAGLKGAFFDGLLNASAAVFRGEKDNVAEVDDSVPPNSLPDGSQAYRATGKGSEVRGFELEVQGSLREGWHLGGGYTHAVIRDRDGVRLNTTVPEDSLRLFTSFRPAGAWHRLSVGGGVTWQSRLYRDAGGGTGWPQQPTGEFDADGNPVTRGSRIEQGPVLLVNAMLGWRFSDRLSAQLNVNNLLDKAYYNNVGFYNGVYWGEPRNWTLSLRWRL
ncbi:TonB-dependent siderophore receptor [Luteimonas sp. Y-2-2-4F]|nr:TonB-dependent siderophore receptor [Luteimonas sp. Y-2-2-4F]MCD9032525.1 TonB-dependent siderophore receptor [Luteimonas sp. Y-2-2-4F]